MSLCKFDIAIILSLVYKHEIAQFHLFCNHTLFCEALKHRSTKLPLQGAVADVTLSSFICTSSSWRLLLVC